MNSRTLTYEQLKMARACIEQRLLFKKMFGESVEVTEELAVSVADKFDFSWAAAHLLSEPAGAEYDRVTELAWAEYNRVTELAWAEYNRVTELARAEYKQVTAAAWAEYNRAIAAAWAEYNRVTELAKAEDNRAIAAAWARAYIRYSSVI